MYVRIRNDATRWTASATVGLANADRYADQDYPIDPGLHPRRAGRARAWPTPWDRLAVLPIAKTANLGRKFRVFGAALSARARRRTRGPGVRGAAGVARRKMPALPPDRTVGRATATRGIRALDRSVGRSAPFTTLAVALPGYGFNQLERTPASATAPGTTSKPSRNGRLPVWRRDGAATDGQLIAPRVRGPRRPCSPTSGDLGVASHAEARVQEQPRRHALGTGFNDGRHAPHRRTDAFGSGCPPRTRPSGARRESGAVVVTTTSRNIGRVDSRAGRAAHHSANGHRLHQHLPALSRRGTVVLRRCSRRGLVPAKPTSACTSSPTASPMFTFKRKRRMKRTVRLERHQVPVVTQESVTDYGLRRQRRGEVAGESLLLPCARSITGAEDL